MSFRDETEALRHRVEVLEREAAEARRERDEARRAATESEAERAARLATSTSFPAGTPVFVEWGGRWWDATVVEVRGPSLWRIHYDGWSARWDEDVGTPRIVARSSRPPGPRAGSGAGITLAVVAVIVVSAAIALSLALD